MHQQTLLRLTKRELGLSYPRLAEALGVSERTIAKWSLDPASGDHREMPLIARKFLARLLGDRKREHLSKGERTAAERIDAISSRLDPAVMRESLRAFDALQLAADAFAPAKRAAAKPRYFRTLAEKNAWQEREALQNARRSRAKSARGR